MDIDHSGQSERLDHYVTRQIPDISRSSSERLVRDGKVKINGEIVTKPAHKVYETDEINVEYAPSTQIAPHIDLPIIYEDKSCVVIDKPAGILSHSKGAFNPEATVATWLSSRVSGLSGERAGIVHRLDRGTSGVMICAKTPEAMAWLQKQFSQRKVKKTYIAVIAGRPELDQAIIELPIGRNPKKPQTFRVSVNGKHAITAYKVLKSDDKLSLLELKPTTGRTHQLRVHMNHLKHPIVGDTLYAGEPTDRLYLHAASLELTLANKKRVTFDSPVPHSFEELING